MGWVSVGKEASAARPGISRVATPGPAGSARRGVQSVSGRVSGTGREGGRRESEDCASRMCIVARCIKATASAYFLAAIYAFARY